jgi:integrase
MARGDGRIYPRGTTFWCEYYVRGEKFRESTKTDDEKKAAKFLRDIVKQKHADELGALTFIKPKMRRLTVHGLLEALKTDFEIRGRNSPQNLSHLRRADKDFGHYLALGLKPEQIDEYKKERLEHGDRPASINRPLQLMIQAYNLATKRNHLNRAPHIDLLSEDGNARQGFFAEPELRAVLLHLPVDLRDFVAFAGATGMRKNECASLTWDMLLDGELQIPADITKNRKARTVPIEGELGEIIERRRAAQPIQENGTVRMTRYIFHRDGEPVREFRKSWARACVAAKVGVMRCPKCKGDGDALICPACQVTTKYEGHIFHDLRRSAVRNMVKAGVSTQVAKKLSGHRSDEVFERYSILNTDDMREAQHKTEKYRGEVAEHQKVVAMATR